jgi:hypothetical protein
VFKENLPSFGNRGDLRQTLVLAGKTKEMKISEQVLLSVLCCCGQNKLLFLGDSMILFLDFREFKNRFKDLLVILKRILKRFQ